MGYVGIDVGKDSLDLAIVAGADGSHVRTVRVANSPAGIEAALGVLREAGTLARVAVEATGAYHTPLVAALLRGGLPTSLVNPAQVVAFRQTLLVRNKTDRQDAVLIARFAATYADQLRVLTPASAQIERLRALVGYRETLVATRTRLLGQQEAAAWQGTAEVQHWLADDRTQVQARLREVERQIASLLSELPEAAVLQEFCGVGVQVTATVLAYLPAEVWGNPKAAAACAGVHPRQMQSGRSQTSRLSKAGSPQVRRALYMAALVAIQRDGDIRTYYDGLVARGKPKLVAVVAVMHKRLRQLMGRLRRFYAERDAAAALAA